MKSINRVNTKVLFLCLIILINGCKKGKDGVDGKNGSANVTATTFNVTSWSSNSSRWYTKVSVPELTLDNINSASVQVYFGTTSNNWVAIPCTVVASTDYFWGFVTAVGLVEVRWDYNGIGIGDSPNEFYGANVQLKVVVIPSSERRKNPNVDLKNYEEVKTSYDVKEQE
jgi:hypothetical protein